MSQPARRPLYHPKEAAPIFWKDHVGKHELYWNFKNHHVSEIKAFSKALRA
jgi:hypothetical protein